MRTMYALKNAEEKYRTVREGDTAWYTDNIDNAYLFVTERSAVDSAERLFKNRRQTYTVVAVEVCRKEIAKVGI